MSNLAGQVASYTSVLEYLRAAYLVDDVTIRAAIAKHEPLVAKGMNWRSHAYYVGNEIAGLEGWQDNPDYNPDEDDDEDDDD